MSELSQRWSTLRLEDYLRLPGWLSSRPRHEAWAQARWLCRTDLFWLLAVVCQRKDMLHPWLLERCREVAASPDGHLDLWARGHYKSTIITYGLTIQSILQSHGEDADRDAWPSECTIGIFSHTRPVAKSFLRQVKRELESNQTLLELFPDILYREPAREAPRWSEDSGLVVRRAANPKESTLEAWGLVDGQPTGKHFSVLVYDDVVTLASVSSPDMIAKTTQAWELSLNLGDRAPRKRMIGTRYHFADTYRDVMAREAAVPRIHPGTVDGTLDGEPVLLTRAEWQQKVREMGPTTAHAQLLLDPRADATDAFRRQWLENRYKRADDWRAMNRALLCDPANSKKRHNDYTAMAVVGYAPDGNIYLLDAVRDRLGLTERADAYIELHRRWKPQHCGYEAYGLQADIDYLRLRQAEKGYRFAVSELGGQMAKPDRIARLIPYASSGRLWLPEDMYRTLSDGRLVDLVQALIEEEMLPFPVSAHDDLVDAISRVFDLPGMAWPRAADEGPREGRYGAGRRAGSWMAG